MDKHAYIKCPQGPLSAGRGCSLTPQQKAITKQGKSKIVVPLRTVRRRTIANRVYYCLSHPQWEREDGRQPWRKLSGELQLTPSASLVGFCWMSMSPWFDDGISNLLLFVFNWMPGPREDIIFCQGLSLLGTPDGSVKGAVTVVSAEIFEHLHHLMLFCYFLMFIILVWLAICLMNIHSKHVVWLIFNCAKQRGRNIWKQ